MALHSRIFGWQYVWKEFADEMGGSAADDGISPEAISVQVPYKPWRLTYYPHATKGKKTVAGTTVVLPFQSPDPFTFGVFNGKGTWSLGNLFGSQGYGVGDGEFDGKFIVQGSDKVKVGGLFGDLALRDRLLEQEGFLELKIVADPKQFSPEWPVPPDHKVLLYTQEPVIDDFIRLKSVYDLMVGVLERIRAVGANKRPGELTIPPRALRSVFLK